MTQPETFYPKEENLGRNCMWWNRFGHVVCSFPKMELQGRMSCEGVIDTVCIWLKGGIPPADLSEEQILKIKTRPPSNDKSDLPPGDTNRPNPLSEHRVEIATAMLKRLENPDWETGKRDESNFYGQLRFQLGMDPGIFQTSMSKLRREIQCLGGAAAYLALVDVRIPDSATMTDLA